MHEKMTTGSCSADARNHVTAMLFGIFEAIGERATLRAPSLLARLRGLENERRPRCETHNPIPNLSNRNNRLRGGGVNERGLD